MDLLLDMSQRWINCLAGKKGGEVRAVALDISKAFDKVWHDGLLFKLKRLGIGGPLLAWLRSYLTNRSQRVLVGSAASELADVLAGVPQGSVLGPILFLVFINDLFDVVVNELDVFADDSTLWSTIPRSADRVDVAKSLNTDLVSIAEWAKRWLVTFNDTKTELVTFSKKKDVAVYHSSKSLDPMFPHPPLSFCGTRLKEARKFKIVGLTFSHNLSWQRHLDNVVLNARRSLSILYRSKPFLPDRTLATIYKSHIRSRMEYCSPLWTGAGSAAQLSKLDAVQAKAIKSFGQEEGSKLQSLSHRRGVAGLCAMHRLVHNTAPEAVSDLCPARASASAPAAPRGRRSCASKYTSNPNSNFLVPPKETSTSPLYWQRSFIPLFTKEFNALPPAIQSITSLKSFKQKVNNSVTFINLYVYKSDDFK